MRIFTLIILSPGKSTVGPSIHGSSPVDLTSSPSDENERFSTCPLPVQPWRPLLKSHSTAIFPTAGIAKNNVMAIIIDAALKFVLKLFLNLLTGIYTSRNFLRRYCSVPVHQGEEAGGHHQRACPNGADDNRVKIALRPLPGVGQIACECSPTDHNNAYDYRYYSLPQSKADFHKCKKEQAQPRPAEDSRNLPPDVQDTPGPDHQKCGAGPAHAPSDRCGAQKKHPGSFSNIRIEISLIEV